jgi:hypothetical protein
MTFQNQLLRGALLTAILGFASCATVPSQRVHWVNPTVEPHLHQSRFTLDSTECNALALKYIPEPSGEAQAPNAFAAGAQRSQRERARREYFTACMLDRRWEQRIQTVDG